MAGGPRRRVGLVAIAAGLATVLAFEVLMPPPAELEYALQDAQSGDGPAVASLAAQQGPAAGRSAESARRGRP